MQKFAHNVVEKMTDYEVAGFVTESWKKKVRSIPDQVWQEPDVDTNIVMAEVGDKVNLRYWKDRDKK